MLLRHAAENNENHAFCNGLDAWRHITALCFQQFAGEIRYLAEQWNFAADQRIRAALSMEKQWNLCRVRKRKIVVTCSRQDTLRSHALRCVGRISGSVLCHCRSGRTSLARTAGFAEKPPNGLRVNLHRGGHPGRRRVLRGAGSRVQTAVGVSGGVSRLVLVSTMTMAKSPNAPVTDRAGPQYLGLRASPICSTPMSGSLGLAVSRSPALDGCGPLLVAVS
jgi:hypothetical protein